MTPTLALLLLASLPGRAPALPNLDFSADTLTHWEGDGFTRTSTGVSSADAGAKGQKGILHRTFRIPAGATFIRFSAAAVRPKGVEPGASLDVVLEAAGRQLIPKLVRRGDRWVDAPVLLPAQKGELREYLWNVEKHAGRNVRIALIDADSRAGCHVICSGFRIVTRDEINAHQFAEAVRKLETAHKLRRMSRYTSDHFLAYSNADPAYTEYRLDNCETIHAEFFKHFRKRGFTVAAPTEKMMVVVFDTQTGFEAYLGQSLSAAVTGLYHPSSNRLVVYDYATNRAFAEVSKRLTSAAKRGVSDLDRHRRTVDFGRYIRERRSDTNITTIMHEVAHQLSFNGGLLNRAGDVPVWLAEGLAVYCESTSGGAWQGIGEANPPRAATLAGPANGRGEFLSLRSLIENDDWLRKAAKVDQVLLGYAQSWALFRMLLEQQPEKLKTYLETIHARRTPEHRLADFAAAFGTDLAKLERRYQGYMRALAKREAK
jgi:hypothetical protein